MDAAWRRIVAERRWGDELEKEDDTNEKNA